MDMYVTSCEPLNGDCLLHVFARRNDDKELLRLIEENSVDRLNNRRETPLIVAAQNSAVRVAKKLIASNANINAQDADGNTPLHHAVLSQSTRFIAILQAQKANGNIVNNNGKTPIHLATEVNASDLLCGLTSRKETVNIEMTNQKGETALICAAKLSCVKAMKTLLAAGSNTRFADVDGKTALHWACTIGNPTVIKLLLNPTTISLKDNFGNTPLAIAVRHGCEKAIDILCRSGASSDIRDMDGNTPIHLACNTNNIYIIKHFLTPEVSPANQPINWQGETPMHIACKNGQLLALDCLIYDGQFLDPIDNRQRTPLMLTIENSHNRLALALLAAKGPNNSTVNVNAKDSCGNTALHYCSLHENTFVANYGANIHEVNILGFTPYTMLTQFGTMEDSVIYQQVYKQHLQSNTAENERRNPSPTYSDFDFSLDDFL